jgi:short-subunit dehydrogenase
MRVVFLGATRGLGRALARLMAARGDRLFLLGRDVGSLERSARDLEVRGAPAPVGVARCDLVEPQGFSAALETASRHLDGFDTVVVTAGIYVPEPDLERRAEERARLFAVDFTGTVEFCEQARLRLLARGGGVLCVFGSVAGDVPRKPVIFYGAAKAGLAFYLEGIDLKFRAQGLRTVLVKPGFVRTGMTVGLREPPLVSTPEAVARAALRGIDHGRAVVYAPPLWRAVTLAVGAIPRALMRRLDF